MTVLRLSVCRVTQYHKTMPGNCSEITCAACMWVDKEGKKGSVKWVNCSVMRFIRCVLVSAAVTGTAKL